MPSVPSALQLLLFTTDRSFAQEAEAAGVNSVIVDWEQHGKTQRQNGYGTEINTDTPADVARLASALSIPVTVRIDSARRRWDEAVACALDHGARRLMLPMAHTVADVDRFLAAVNGRAETIVQIETQSLVDQCADLRQLPWDHAYVGLNDLMICRNGNWLWEPFLDGTADRIFDQLQGRSVGIGGVTVVGGGAPIPFVALLREMARLGCQLSFLRRTFKREIEDRRLEPELRAVQAVWQAACQRGPDSIQQDHRRFQQLLRRLRPVAASATSSRPAATSA
ncbi:MAG: hypothetical protein R6T83_09520 [Salinibacter sp.]